MDGVGPVAAGVVERLGRWCYRRKWRVLALSLLTVAALAAIGGAVGGEFRQSFALPGSETQAAADRLAAAGFEDLGGYSATVVVAGDDVEHGEGRATLSAFLDAVEANVEGVTAHRPDSMTGGHQMSEDGSVAYARLDFAARSRGEADAMAAEIAELRAATPVPAGVELELGGELFFEEGDFTSEGLGLIAAAVILLVAFGSVLAMGLPIATALVGIGGGFAVVLAATRVLDIPPFTPGVVAMIGLAAGIDYALLIVTRYREELARGWHGEDAVARAMATAGRSTVFAGATVVTSLLGLLVIGLDDVRSVAVAAAAGVLFVMTASLTVLPALLGVVGRHIDRFGLPHRRRLADRDAEGAGWDRWTRLLQRRPKSIATAALLVLVVLATPMGSLRLGLADASNRPRSDTSRRAHDLLADGFGAGANGPLLLAVALPSDGDAADQALVDLEAALEADVGIDQTLPTVTNDAGDTAFVLTTPRTGPQDEATARLVERLRAQTLPAALAPNGADALVGGAAAAAVDFAAHSARTLPWFIAAVLIMSFGLLIIVFRSVLVPLKAVAVNLLTVGAAYGMVVAVFQWGWLGGVFGLGQPGPVEAWVPMMLFAIVFGLSIDYEVFLMSRIRERYDLTGDNSAAVAHGLSRTARLITAAAAIMVCVFGAFALSDERSLQMLGVGMAFAIAVDATLVRLVLVPATMELLGRRNWWLPAWIERVLPRPAARPEAGSAHSPTPVRVDAH